MTNGALDDFLTQQVWCIFSPDSQVTTHEEKTTPVPLDDGGLPSSDSSFLLFRSSSEFFACVVSGTSFCSQVNSSGQSSPPYAKASFFKVLLVPMMCGRGKRGSSRVNELGTPGSRSFLSRQGGREPDVRIRENTWSKWAWVMR